MFCCPHHQRFSGCSLHLCSVTQHLITHTMIVLFVSFSPQLGLHWLFFRVFESFVDEQKETIGVSGLQKILEFVWRDDSLWVCLELCLCVSHFCFYIAIYDVSAFPLIGVDIYLDQGLHLVCHSVLVHLKPVWQYFIYSCIYSGRKLIVEMNQQLMCDMSCNKTNHTGK